MYVRDNACSGNGLPIRPKADPTIDGQLGAPMKGKEPNENMASQWSFTPNLAHFLGDVVDVKIDVGDAVEKGQVVAVLSAMKMEMAVQVIKML